MKIMGEKNEANKIENQKIKEYLKNKSLYSRCQRCSWAKDTNPDLMIYYGPAS